VVNHLDPIFATLAPGIGDIPRTPGRDKSAPHPSWVTCTAVPTAPVTSSKWSTTALNMDSWPAYAEGLGVLRDANIGKQQHEIDAEDDAVTRSRVLPNMTSIWEHRGGVAPRQCDRLVVAGFDGDCTGQGPRSHGIRWKVSDSGEGDGPIKAAIDEGVPVPVLTTALYERFSSRG